MFWHTDNYHLTLEEPQLKALHGKKLKINVRAGELSMPASSVLPINLEVLIFSTAGDTVQPLCT